MKNSDRGWRKVARHVSAGAAVALAGMCPLLFGQTNVKAGFGKVVGPNMPHPNGQVFDQVLMTGSQVTVAADAGQVVRVSFLDPNDDIVQVEFSGSGTVNIDLEASSYRPPAPPAKYNQPEISYVKGHAMVHVQGAKADTFVSIFSIGRANAVNQGLFPAGMTYDAMADVRLLWVEGSEAGALLTGNARFTGSNGTIGIQAPDTPVRYRTIVGEINAEDEAVPLLRIGESSALQWDAGAVLVAGGSLRQSNGSPVDVTSRSGAPLPRLNFVNGTRSSGDLVTAQPLSALLASRLPGSVSVDGVARKTRGYVPASFDELRAEAGIDAFNFGLGTTVWFSGGNNGTYSITGDEVIEGERVHFTLSGSYRYSVEGANQNRMSFSLDFGHLQLTSRSLSFGGSIYELANLSGEVLPLRITAAAEFQSAVSGSATFTLHYTSGAVESYPTNFDLEHGLDFGLF